MKYTHTLPPILLIGLLLTLSSLPTVQAATNCAAVTEIPKAQCDTLLALYNSTGGANWTNKTGWNVTNTPCSWDGITCNSGNVTNISLVNNVFNLTGSLPDLSALTGLQTLYLYYNQLTGTIPDLSKLTSLRELHLGGNQLTGTIPDLSKLTNLRVLALWGNQLTGNIPDLSKLTSLQILYLHNNQLTGAIPDLSKLISLQLLYLSDNQLTGPIPDLSKLTSLQYIVLNNNKLTGAIPDLTKLTSLLRLWLNDNQLSGPIPSLNTLPLEDTLEDAPDGDKEMIWGLNLSNNSQLCRDPNANYGTQTYKISGLAICSTVPLTITKTGTGTGIVITTSNATINCGTTCQANLVLNSTVTLTATPATDSTFTSWSGACTGTTANVAVTMDTATAKNCTATFNKKPLLTINKTGTGTGEVKTADATINCGTTCQSSFSMNNTVTLTATPAAYSTFTGWSGNCTGTTANVTVTMNAAKTCTANFNLLPFSCNNVTEIPKTQCDTLVALYNSTGGTNWTDKTGWTQTNTPCSWKGITCNSGNVTNISLASNNLKGSLPTLSALTGLQILDLSWNQLTGTLPNLSMLTNLQILYLQYNQFTGSILDWSKLTKLRNLYLDDNQLTGTIPNWSMLTSLQALILNNNQLTGTIPDVSKLTSLQRFYLNNNQLTGTLPNWSQLTNLRYIIFNNNQLTGTLPDWSKLTNLLYLGLAGNQLTGTLPDWSKLTNLQNLYLNENQLTGTIPDWSMLTNLQNLYLSRNQLTGTIPDWSKLINLRNLYLSNNQLTGTIPDWSKLTSLPNLVLNNNQLTGTIPEWNMLTNLQMLYLAANQLSGPIPSLNTLTKLTTLQLSSNPQLCRDPNANYGTRTEVNSFSLCGSTLALTVTKTGTGTGAVKTADATLDCGTTCQGIYATNSTITLTATPATYSIFTGWSGDCTGTIPDALVIMNAAKNCTANFDKTPLLTLSVNKTGTGEVRTADAIINCGTTCQGDFSANTPVTLIAISSTGSTFTGWTGDCTGTDTSITLTMNAAKTCTASFATVSSPNTTTSCPTTTTTPVTPTNPVVHTQPVTLTLTKTGTGTGEIHSSDTTLNCGPTCQADYPQNSNLTLTAVPATDSTFTGWGGGCTGTNPEITVTMDTAKICLAHFDQPTSTTDTDTTTAPANGTEDTFCNPVLEIPKAQCQTLVTLYDHTNGPNWPHRDGWRTTPTPCTWTGITCTNGNVTAINLTGNNLLGTFPDLTLLTQLQSLQLSNNLLTGTMPTYLKDLTQLRTLALDHNPDLCRDNNLNYGSLTGIYAVSQCLTHPIPIAAFKASTLTGPAPLPVTLDATVSTVDGSISNYQWETSDGQTLTGATPSLTYNQSGTYTITLKVTDNQGATSTNVAKQTITVTSTQPTLTVRKTGNGRGQLKVRVGNQESTVCKTADPCPENGLDYPVGTAIKLTASTIEGVIFKGWNGDCGGTATTVNLTMDSNKTCIADFVLDNTAPNRYTLTVQAIGTGQGTIEGAGINCGEDCTDNYKAGKPLWLKAVPEIDSIFGGWSGDCAGQTKQSIELVIDSNKTCQVAFNSRDITMSYLGVDNLIANAELDTGEEIYDRYPRYPFNDERLQDALWLAEPVLALLDRQVDVTDLNSTWPRQLNGIDQGLRGAYTESVKVMEDAEIQGFLARATVLGKYVEVRVKLLNDVGIEEVLPILIYYGEPPTIAQAAGTLAPTTVTYHLVRTDKSPGLGSGRIPRCTRPRC